MSRPVHRFAALGVAALALLAARVPPSHAADLSVPDRAIEGIWRFDAKKSDDPAKAMPRGGPGGAAQGGMRGGPGGSGGPPMGGGMGSGRRGGPPGGGPGMGGGPDGERPEEGGSMGDDRHPRVDPMRRVMRPAAQIVIFVLSENVEITEDQDPPLTFALQDSLDAHGRVQEIPGPVARWKDASLVTKLPLGKSGSLTETWEFSADGRTLTVHAKSEGGPQGAPKIELKRVYNRYDGE